MIRIIDGERQNKTDREKIAQEKAESLQYEKDKHSLKKIYTLHIADYAEDINILDRLSDEHKLPESFCYEEESTEVIQNTSLRIYICDTKCELEQAIEGHLKTMLGNMSITGQCYGYSEVTIEGFEVREAKLGGHYIQDIIDSHKGKYLHILMDFNIKLNDDQLNEKYNN